MLLLASLAAKILPRPRVDEVLDDHRDTGGAAVANDLIADGKRLGDQVRLAGGRDGAVGAQLEEELEGIAALIQDPLGVQVRVAVGTRLALVAAPLGRFGGDEQPAPRGQRLRRGDGRDAVGRVGQQAGGGRGQHAEQDIIVLTDGQRFGWADPDSLKRWQQVAGQLRPAAGEDEEPRPQSVARYCPRRRSQSAAVVGPAAIVSLCSAM